MCGYGLGIEPASRPAGICCIEVSKPGRAVCVACKLTRLYRSTNVHAAVSVHNAPLQKMFPLVVKCSPLVIGVVRSHRRGSAILSHTRTLSSVAKTFPGAYLEKSCVPLGNCLRTPCLETTTKPSGFLATQQEEVMMATSTKDCRGSASALLRNPSPLFAFISAQECG